MFSFPELPEIWVACDLMCITCIHKWQSKTKWNKCYTLNAKFFLVNFDLGHPNWLKLLLDQSIVLVRMHNALQLHAMHNTHAQLCTTNLHNGKHNIWFICIVHACCGIVHLCTIFHFMYNRCTTLCIIVQKIKNLFRSAQ